MGEAIKTQFFGKPWFMALIDNIVSAYSVYLI